MLLQTGVYNEEDVVIKELDASIQAALQQLEAPA